MADETAQAAGTEVETPGPVAISGRAMTIAAMERLVSRIAEGADPTEDRSGTEYLLFACGQVPCAVPLAELREVLPALPAPVPLPFSPPWFFGVFPLRLDVLGLVDPTRMLLGTPTPAPSPGTTATALVAGEDTLLALMVTAIGDIALIQPEDIHDGQDGEWHQVVQAYARGYCTPQSGGTYVVLDMPRLVNDLVRLLMEVAAHE